MGEWMDLAQYELGWLGVSGPYGVKHDSLCRTGKGFQDCNDKVPGEDGGGGNKTGWLYDFFKVNTEADWP
jgi:hypothetical protein